MRNLNLHSRCKSQSVTTWISSGWLYKNYSRPLPPNELKHLWTVIFGNNKVSESQWHEPGSLRHLFLHIDLPSLSDHWSQIQSSACPVFFPRTHCFVFNLVWLLLIYCCSSIMPHVSCDIIDYFKWATNKRGTQQKTNIKNQEHITLSAVHRGAWFKVENQQQQQ